MTAAGINPYDAKIAAGILRGRPHRFPLILGVDGAGTVELLGPQVRRFRPGDRIFGQFLHDPVGTGTYAEYASVPEQNAVSDIPEGLGDAEAAALPTAGMTALDSLDRLEPAPGSSLLVVGASGGIGSLVVPLAKARGARVIAVARTASADRLRSLGASEVVEPGAPNWMDRVRAVAADGVDAALDLMSDRPGFRAVQTLVRAGGRAASTVYAVDATSPPVGQVRAFNIDLQPSSRLLERMAREVLDNRVKVPIGRTVALESAPEALAEIRAGRGVGKTVILFSDARG
jgi:NADPH:quinone reductase